MARPSTPKSARPFKAIRRTPTSNEQKYETVETSGDRIVTGGVIVRCLPADEQLNKMKRSCPKHCFLR